MVACATPSASAAGRPRSPPPRFLPPASEVCHVIRDKPPDPPTPPAEAARSLPGVPSCHGLQAQAMVAGVGLRVFLNRLPKTRSAATSRDHPLLAPLVHGIVDAHRQIGKLLGKREPNRIVGAMRLHLAGLRNRAPRSRESPVEQGSAGRGLTPIVHTQLEQTDFTEGTEPSAQSSQSGHGVWLRDLASGLCALVKKLSFRKA